MQVVINEMKQAFIKLDEVTHVLDEVKDFYTQEQYLALNKSELAKAYTLLHTSMVHLQNFIKVAGSVRIDNSKSEADV